MHHRISDFHFGAVEGYGRQGGIMKRGDTVVLTDESQMQDIPGCLSYEPFSGKVLSLWETNDGGKFVDVHCNHVTMNPHETTYHQDFVRVV
jgi:hypothetical protein